MTLKTRNELLEDLNASSTGIGDQLAASIDVNIQDQTSPLVNLYFGQPKGAIPTTLTANVAIGDLTCDVASVADIAPGDYLGMFDTAGMRYYFATVISVATLTVTVDTPFDFAFQSGDPVISQVRDLNNAAGTPSSPQIFEIQGPTNDTEVDITRLIFTMTLSSNPDDALFGNIAALTYGLVLRKTDGVVRNIFNIKDNGELAGISYDLAYTTRSGGGGDFGLRCRYTFAGQSKQGVTIRLGAGEKLELLVQDDLTSIGRFRVVAEGHEVE